MSVIFILIPVSILFAAFFLGAFFWAVRSGQYEDTTTPSMRVLLEEANRSATKSADKTATSDKPEQTSTHQP